MMTLVSLVDKGILTIDIMDVVRHNYMGVVCNYFKKVLIAPNACRSAFQFKQSQDINFYVSLFNNVHATNVKFYH